MDQQPLDFNRLPADLSPIERRVAQILQRHRGEEHRIARTDLVALSGLSDRQLRELIARLIVDRHLPLAASSKSGGGYYWMARLDEVLGEMRKLHSYAVDLHRREGALKRIGRERFNARGDLFEVTDGV